MPDDDPEELRRRAYRYWAMVQHVYDRQAVKVLEDMAREFMDQAERIDAKKPKTDSPDRSS